MNDIENKVDLHNEIRIDEMGEMSEKIDRIIAKIESRTYGV